MTDEKYAQMRQIRGELQAVDQVLGAKHFVADAMDRGLLNPETLKRMEELARKDLEEQRAMLRARWDAA